MPCGERTSNLAFRVVAVNNNSRLHTVIEKIMEEVSFECDKFAGQKGTCHCRTHELAHTINLSLSHELIVYVLL